MKQIVLEVTDEANALAEKAAAKFGFDSPAEWATEWLKESLVQYAQQQHTAIAQKAFEKEKRSIHSLFEKE